MDRVAELEMENHKLRAELAEARTALEVSETRRLDMQTEVRRLLRQVMER